MSDLDPEDVQRMLESNLNESNDPRFSDRERWHAACRARELAKILIRLGQDSNDGWACNCGEVSTSNYAPNFCPNCGSSLSLVDDFVEFDN